MSPNWAWKQKQLPIDGCLIWLLQKCELKVAKLLLRFVSELCEELIRKHLFGSSFHKPHRMTLWAACGHSDETCTHSLLLERMWVRELRQAQPCSKTVLFISLSTWLCNSAVWMRTVGGGCQDFCWLLWRVCLALCWSCWFISVTL